VKNPYRWAALAVVALSFGCVVALAVAQGPARPVAGQPMSGQPAAGQPSPGQNIALLDVTYIFKNHAGFKAEMERMKADVQAAEGNIKAQRDKLAKVAEDMQNYRKGTPEYKAAEEQLANGQAKMSLDVQRQKKDFLQKEAAIYNSVYQEIFRVTDYYCKQNGIDLVIKFNGDPVDVDQPDSVLAYINKPVVWYQQRLDITLPVLTQLNGRAPVNPGPAARPGVQMPPR
jgi:Skp family chaperone for outer membrane proteins